MQKNNQDKLIKTIYIPSIHYNFSLLNEIGTDKEKIIIAKHLHKINKINSKIFRRCWNVKNCSICGKKIKPSQAIVIVDHKNIFHSACQDNQNNQNKQNKTN